jgi:hypothetical protein
MTEDLKNSFDNLSAEDKIAFLKTIMPDICALFREEPRRMMAEMMPLCRQMMEGCDVDMQQMMSMMQMMKQNPSA